MFTFFNHLNSQICTLSNTPQLAFLTHFHFLKPPNESPNPVLSLLRWPLSLLLSKPISDKSQKEWLIYHPVEVLTFTFIYTIISNVYRPMNHPTLFSFGLLRCSLSLLFVQQFPIHIVQHPILSSLGLLRCSLSLFFVQQSPIHIVRLIIQHYPALSS